MYISELSQLPNIARFLEKIDETKYEKAIGELARAFAGRVMGEGTTRVVYNFSDDRVIKVPKVDDGFDHFTHTIMVNVLEYMMYERLMDKVPLAPCQLVFYKCVPLIIMDKVKCMDEGDELEYDWVDKHPESILNNLNDGFQIGRLPSGKVVCYDYGYEGDIFCETTQEIDLTDEELTKLGKFSPKITGMKELNPKLRNALIKSLLKTK
jgi:hypothetical protein